MKIDVTKTIDDLNDDPIPLNPNEPEGAKMMLGDVLTVILLAPSHPPGSEYPAAQSIQRYDLALEIHRARKAEAPSYEVEITAEMATALKSGVNRLYAPLVSGQVLRALDGK